MRNLIDLMCIYVSKYVCVCACACLYAGCCCMQTYSVCIDLLVSTLSVFVYVTCKSASFSQEWNRLRPDIFFQKTPCFHGFGSDF